MTSSYYTFDERRKIALPGEHEVALTFAANLWLEIGEQAIKDHGFFAVALSGGATPKKIFQILASQPEKLDWSKVFLFWSDERSVPPTHPESNYRMALEDGSLSKLPIAPNQIFRMVAEEDIEANAKAYEDIILDKLGSHPFDLIMLGMGEDGHTASLFPHTKGLQVKGRLVIANYVPQKNTWRMTFTYECINRAHHICVYVMGAAKADVLEKILLGSPQPETFPLQRIGLPSNPALFIIDTEAGKNLIAHLK